MIRFYCRGCVKEMWKRYREGIEVFLHDSAQTNITGPLRQKLEELLDEPEGGK